jgi:hypothetical protein
MPGSHLEKNPNISEMWQKLALSSSGPEGSKGQALPLCIKRPRSRQNSTITEGRHRPVPSRIIPIALSFYAVVIARCAKRAVAIQLDCFVASLIAMTVYFHRAIGIKSLGGHPQNDEMDAGSLPPFCRPWSSSPNILASPAFGRNGAPPSLESGFKHSGDRVHGLKSSEVDGSACSATSVLKVMDLKTALGLERGSVG